MTVHDLTGYQRVRIFMHALKHHTAHEIAEAVDVPKTVVRQLCRSAGIALAEAEEAHND